jgi:hypothetical protein
MITSIDDSVDLAVVLNAPPATPEDAAETPRDWLDGVWVAGNVYPLDPEYTSETLAVLADGTAAVRNVDGRWFPEDRQEWATGDARGVIHDWRSVYVWDANGFTEYTVYPTVMDAFLAFGREVTALVALEVSP